MCYSVSSKLVLAWTEENPRGEMPWWFEKVQRLEIRPWELFLGF